MFLKEIYYIDVNWDDQLESNKNIEFLELPKCPKCIEKIDGSITSLNIDVIQENKVYVKKNR